MNKTSSLMSVCAISMALIGGAAQAKPSLWTYDKISKGLFDMAVADTVGDKCPTISARKIRGLGFAQSLFSYAKSKGYSYSEVKAFVEDDVEKAKLRKRVVTWLKSEGVNIDNNQSFCPLGEREIKKKSQIGQLLAN